MSDDLRKQEFDLNISFLTDASKSFVTNTGVVAGFLITSIGWVASSEKTQAFLAKHPSSAWLASAALVATCGLYAWGSWVVYSSAHKSYSNLVSLQYLPTSAFEARQLRLSAFFVCVLGILSLGAFAVCLLIFGLP
jgi:hypothetical protein